MREDIVFLDSAAYEALCDLRVQSMIFDMDIDLETASLTPKQSYVEPIWLARWKDKMLGGDRQPEDYEGGE